MRLDWKTRLGALLDLGVARLLDRDLASCKDRLLPPKRKRPLPESKRSLDGGDLQKWNQRFPVETCSADLVCVLAGLQYACNAIRTVYSRKLPNGAL